MNHNIIMLRMPPHSSHLCQPLDLGVFSALKQAVTREISKIMDYGVPTIKKFEWADAYRLARPQAFTEKNIKAGFANAGLYPLNRRRVISRLRNTSSPKPDGNSNSELVEISSSAFEKVPDTPSKLDSNVLREANAVLKTNIDAGVLNTPIKSYIGRLSSLAEQLRAGFIVIQHQFIEQGRILKRRREQQNGKRVALEDEICMTTPELLAKAQAAEMTSSRKQRKTGGNSKQDVTSGVVVQSVRVVEYNEGTNALHDGG